MWQNNVIFICLFMFYFRMQDVIYRLSKVGIGLHLFLKIWN